MTLAIAWNDGYHHCSHSGAFSWSLVLMKPVAFQLQWAVPSTLCFQYWDLSPSYFDQFRITVIFLFTYFFLNFLHWEQVFGLPWLSFADGHQNYSLTYLNSSSSYLLMSRDFHNYWALLGLISWCISFVLCRILGCWPGMSQQLKIQQEWNAK